MRGKGFLVKLCASTSLAALNYEGCETAHSLFNYPVSEEEDQDVDNPLRCNVSKQRLALLHHVKFIVWDEFVNKSTFFGSTSAVS